MFDLYEYECAEFTFPGSQRTHIESSVRRQSKMAGYVSVHL